MLTRFVVRENGSPIHNFYGKETKNKAYSYANKYEDECNLRGYFPKITVTTDTIESLSGTEKAEFQRFGYVR